MSGNLWYNEEADFFGPCYMKEYEDILTQKRTVEEIDFLEKMIPLKKGLKIFDCPCGYGRHSIELARRGYSVTGQDSNNFFIQQAKKSAMDYGLNINLIEGDMREVKFQEEFDVALNLFTSLGYFEDEEEDQKVISQAEKALKPGGVFVLDSQNRDQFIRNFKKSEWKKLNDGSLILKERNFDHTRGRINEKKIRIWGNGRRDELKWSLRAYSIPEIVKMIEKTRLTFEKIYGGFKDSPVTFRSMRIVILARKI